MKCSECSAKVRPVVCIDIDGTLAQYHQALCQFIEWWLPAPRLPRSWGGEGEFSDHIGIEKDVYRQAKLAFRAGGFKRNMTPFKGAVEFMQELERLDVEVWMTTTRPWQRMDNVDPDTKEWLRRYGIPYKHLLFDEDKYGLMTELVDPDRIVMVLDDEYEQRDRCEELNLPFVLRGTAWNQNIGAEFKISQYDQAIDLVRERIGVRDALRLFG